MNVCGECGRQEMHAEFLCGINLRMSTWNTKKEMGE